MKVKKSDRKKLVKELDRVFSLYIRARDKKCCLCGTTESLQCGHLFSRVAYSTRWDEANCYAQCASCNLKHEHNAWPFYRWFIGIYGQKAFDDLHELYGKPRKYADSELLDEIQKFKIKLKGL
jgi:hypothetical protein